jgi:geranylgeranyl diphosphate synthase, type I
MHGFFALQKPLIAKELARVLAEMQPDLARVNRWADDATDRLAAFAVQGKMVRGGLLLLSYQMLAGNGSGRAPKPPRAVVRAAAAVELLHSALLIHDDIMDNDRLRRGFRTIFAQYESLGARGRADDAAGFGRNMGICAGDVAFFIATDIVARLGVDAERRLALQALLARELSYVGLAQMQDVSFGAFSRTPPVRDVYTLYLYKTARYTFSLPLMAGALLAGRSGKILKTLAELGEYLGVVFQARDDEIGVFGTEGETGKPVGSDIREGKKTLLYIEFLRRAGGAEKRKLAGLAGKAALAPSDVAMVRWAIERSGARKRLKDMMAELASRADKIIGSLRIPESHREILREICAESMQRSR